MTRCGYATEMSYHRADRQLPDDGEDLQDRIMLRGDISSPFARHVNGGVVVSPF